MRDWSPTPSPYYYSTISRIELGVWLDTLARKSKCKSVDLNGLKILRLAKLIYTQEKEFILVQAKIS